MQLQTKVEVPGAERYNGMVDCFKKIIKSEGLVVESQGQTRRKNESRGWNSG